VLNELDSVINSCQSVVMLSIFSDPSIMLAVSGVLLSGIESLISLDVLDGLSEVRFSISQLSDGVVSQLGVSTLLGNVIVDVGVQISEDLENNFQITHKVLSRRQPNRFCSRHHDLSNPRRFQSRCCSRGCSLRQQGFSLISGPAL
jgi:hypothetical protein